VFRNTAKGVDGPMMTVRVGQPFRLQEQVRHGRVAEYRFTVLSSDPQRQEATVMGEVEAKE
jgi:hypothetical protein